MQPHRLGHPASVLQVNIMAALRHPNIVLFMGVCLDPPCVVSEWCARGSLYDVLSKARKNANLAPQLDWTRRLNMALDAAKAGRLIRSMFAAPCCSTRAKAPRWCWQAGCSIVLGRSQSQVVCCTLVAWISCAHGRLYARNVADKAGRICRDCCSCTQSTSSTET